MATVNRQFQTPPALNINALRWPVIEKDAGSPAVKIAPPVYDPPSQPREINNFDSGEDNDLLALALAIHVEWSQNLLQMASGMPERLGAPSSSGTE